ncbi:hypothetical protein C358_00383 [Cryptococcus neoformans MW-RSA852]|nr:hypothetical protein C358_00383 [Cryptococcus neoformans var. grubii MW-RSA852]
MFKHFEGLTKTKKLRVKVKTEEFLSHPILV